MARDDDDRGVWCADDDLPRPAHQEVGQVRARGGVRRGSRASGVLVEKPLADSVRAAYEMAAAAERSGLVGVTYYPSGFGWHGQTLKRLARGDRANAGPVHGAARPAQSAVLRAGPLRRHR